MRILILSWRDIKHPYGGGAELLSHEISKRWVRDGHEVFHYSATFPGSKNIENIDGVSYIREGNWYNIHLKAFLKIILNKMPQTDIIIDEVHGIPFFASIYSQKPVVCLACEVAKEIWDQMYPFPISVLGKVLEKLYLHLYKNLKFITISPSTKNDLIINGINPNNITVLPMGFSYSLPSSLPKKSISPLIIFLGRLAKSKGVPDAIEAFSIINSNLPDSRLIIVGRGNKEYEIFLKDLVVKKNLDKFVEFKGFVEETEKFKLLAQSHIILVPSVKEGWGLIVPEANLVGVVSVVYDVPGLKDVTKNGINGVIVKENNFKQLAKESIRLFKDQPRLARMSKSSVKYAKSLSWDNTAKVGLEVIRESLKS